MSKRLAGENERGLADLWKAPNWSYSPDTGTVKRMVVLSLRTPRGKGLSRNFVRLIGCV